MQMQENHEQSAVNLEPKEAHQKNHAKLKVENSNGDLSLREKMRIKFGAKVLGVAVKIGLGLTGPLGWVAGEITAHEFEKKMTEKQKALKLAKQQQEQEDLRKKKQKEQEKLAQTRRNAAVPN